jgi:sialate O-acetylesterase
MKLLMNKTKLISAGLLIVFLMASVMLRAEIKLPAVFGDNMVLQQQTDAAIWGKATPKKNVKVTTSWDRRSYTTLSDSKGDWKLKVKTPSAGGPYYITITDGKELRLNNVLIGEVWVCSGQSNMQMTMTGYRNQPIIGSNEAIATSSNKSIRLLTVTRNTSVEILDDFEGQWLECEPENVANFSATAYFFGRMVQQALNVPVGLICSSWGGTRIEPWISEDGLKGFDWVVIPDKDQQEKINQNSPTVLYNAMISPLAGYAIRGGLWYQGESNRNEPDKYCALMPGLVENWRKAWGIGDFPFYYVQIAPFDYGPSGVNSAFLREAQLKASTAIPNIGMACLMDAGEKDCIHPADKKAAGERLAYLALAKTYGKNGFAYSGPVLKEMTVEGGLVKLTFDHASNGLTSYGKELENFKIAGENKRFYPAKAFITGTGITLFSPAVEKPVAVRYAFDDFVMGDLFNTEGLPASSFRTDEWER